MSMMMMALMMGNYNQMVTPTNEVFQLNSKDIDPKNTPTSVLQDLGIIPRE